VEKYLHELALLNKNLKEQGPSEALYAKADTLLKQSPIDNYITADEFLKKRIHDDKTKRSGNNPH
jgi:hypothetical protein